MRDGVAMGRRGFLALVGGALLVPARPARAQSGGPLRRIGFLGNSTEALEANLVGPFRDGLREHGYVEGRNLVVEYRWADGQYERMPALVQELIALQVEVIVTAGTPAALAVKRATSRIPLVMVAVGDPVGSGLVASLAHPGGNLTGLVSIAPDLEGKRLELLKEIVPRLSSVAFLKNPSNRFHVTSEKQAREAARTLQVKAEFFPVRTAADLDRAFSAIADWKPGALVMLADRVFLHNRARIVEFTDRARLPAVYPYTELVDAGGLMSFGPSYPGMHRRAAYYVDRILKGARAADLPMEQPAQFELIVNLKAARSLGLTIPQPVLLRADQVLE
ncbi:MAG TPA: ABC transporter substrate-binding protein [Methylomirabilota bacterium]|jgi:putative ABC transport system substrate-binding protein